MNTKYLTIIFLLQFALSSVAQSPDVGVLLQEAESAQKGENYALAITKYEEVLSLGHYSDDLYANLGLTYLLSGEIEESILNLEKALLIDPGNGAAQTNLILAKEGIEDRVTFIPDFLLIEWRRSLVKSMSTTSWIIMHGMFLLLALVLLALYWLRLDTSFSEGIKEWRGIVPTIIGLVALSALFLAIAVQRNTQLKGVNYGVIMEDVTLHQGSDSRSTVVTEVSAGSRTLVLDDLNEWYKVQLDDKDEGWLLKEHIELIRISD